MAMWKSFGHTNLFIAMSEINKKYSIKATVLSPLSVGQGYEKDWIEGVDYIKEPYNDKYSLNHIDLSLLRKAGINMGTYSELLSSHKIKDLTQLLAAKIEDICDFQMEMPIATDNPIKTFYFNPLLEDNGKYVLFGSSIKGAIRSSLFHYFSEGQTAYDLQGNNKSLNDFIFGNLKDGTNFMRFIRVSDFNFEETELINTKIYNLFLNDQDWEGGWKHARDHTDIYFTPRGFNTIYECLKPGTSSTGSIMISPTLFQIRSSTSFTSEMIDFMKNPFTNLFQIINNSTKEHLEKEIVFFKEYNQGEKSDEIIESLTKYYYHLKTIIDNNHQQCILKMAAGTGFHMITGDWKYKDYIKTGTIGGKKRYKSRKIACKETGLTPMGYLNLSLI